MRHEITVSQRMVSGARRLQAAVRRGGGVGRLVVAGNSYDSYDGGDFFSVITLACYHAITCNGVVATRVGTAGHDILMGTNGLRGRRGRPRNREATLSQFGKISHRANRQL